MQLVAGVVAGVTKLSLPHSLWPSDIFVTGSSLDDTTPSTLSPSVTWIHKKGSKCLIGRHLCSVPCSVCVLWACVFSHSFGVSRTVRAITLATARVSSFPQTSVLTSTHSAMSPLHMGGGLQHLLHLDYPLCDLGGCVSLNGGSSASSWQGS